MSQGPSTFGSMMTSSLAPAAGTISRMSSSAQGELRALMRVHRPVWPKSLALAMSMKPRRAATLASAGMASSRLPSTTSTWPMRSLSRRGSSRCGAARNGSCARAHGQLAEGLGRADGERGEVLGGSADGATWRGARCCAATRPLYDAQPRAGQYGHLRGRDGGLSPSAGCSTSTARAPRASRPRTASAWPP